MTDENHIGDRNDMVVGDNDHGDAIPKCGSCGVAWVDHIGIMGVCAEVAQLRAERDEARREVQSWIDLGGKTQRQINQLREERDAAIKQRDEARRMYCALKVRFSADDPTTRCIAEFHGWDCYGYKKETQ